MRGARLPVVATIWAGSFFLAFDRVNISLAAPDIMRDIVLDGAQMGLVLSMYYWGYTFGNFAGGLVSPTLRLRGLTSLLIVVWAALTAVTGLCNLLWQFCVVRVLFGIAEGATANLMHRLQNNWLLPAERGRGYGIFIGFVYLGIALGMPLVGALIKLADWRVMFLLSAVLTLALAAAVFWFMVRDHPWQHPRVPAPEGQQFQDIITRDRMTLADSPPELTLAQRLPALFAIPSFAWLCVASFFVIGVYFTNMSWLPGYLVKERGYTVLASGIYLTIPYLAAFAGMWSAGSIGDRYGHRARVAMVMALMTCPAILLLTTTDDVNTTIALAGVMLFLNSAALNGIMVLLFDLLPASLFGTGVGMVGGLAGGLSGIVGPLLMGYLYDLTGSFFGGFVTLAAGTLLGAAALWPVANYEKRVRGDKARLHAAASGAA
ncbi:MAG: MFS transporter [Proteobacteria bacterium]|nr:MFS transporter [Pseudomonadota bacterium]